MRWQWKTRPGSRKRRSTCNYFFLRSPSRWLTKESHAMKSPTRIDATGCQRSRSSLKKRGSRQCARETITCLVSTVIEIRCCRERSKRLKKKNQSEEINEFAKVRNRVKNRSIIMVDCDYKRVEDYKKRGGPFQTYAGRLFVDDSSTIGDKAFYSGSSGD